MANKPSPTRLRYNKLIFAGLKALSWSKDGAQFQGLLQGAGARQKPDGSFSLSSLEIGKLMAIYDELKKAGFKPKPKSAASRAAVSKQGQIKKIIAIWCALADAGVVRDRSEAAMTRWCAGITGKARLEWAYPQELIVCIESLKKWAKREKVNLSD